MLTYLENTVIKINTRFGINVNLLLTFCFVAQHSFVIKFAALFLLVFLNIRSFSKFSIRKIPAFYILLSVLEVAKFIFLSQDYSSPHFLQFSVGMFYWVASLAVCWILYYTVTEQTNFEKSIQVIALLNLGFTLYQYLVVCKIEHTINPYNTGHNHPYGISTGDLLSGLFHGVHLTNAFVSIFLCFFFIDRKHYLFVFVALFSLLFTGNNYATIVLALGSGILFITCKDLKKRLVITSLAFVTALFYIFITPLNAEYMLEKVAHISATLPNSKRVFEKEEEQKSSGYIEVVEADTLNPYDIEGVHSKKTQVKIGSKDTLFNFITQSGKVRSYHMTKNFLASSVKNFLFGAGIGGFSSKLAFNTSGAMEGSSLSKVLPNYQTQSFENNHKALYVYLRRQHIMFHSESNRPFSVYNQLLGEYGLVGLFLFAVFYLWYFLKRISYKTYALPSLIALLLVFNIDYLFEGLSVVLFFEALMYFDIKSKNNAQV